MCRVIYRNLKLGGGGRQMFGGVKLYATRQFTLKDRKTYTKLGGGVVSQLGEYLPPREGGCESITSVMYSTLPLDFTHILR